MKMDLREAYCPAHFGNSYEAMWPLEMAQYLDELKYWGFNRYGDWMTTTDSCDPYESDATWNLPMELLARKKDAFRHATQIGLDNNLILTPNHVYLDQLRPELLAEKVPRIFGQLLCPSIPEARAIIHRNLERQFQDLAESGVQLSAFTAFAYDYGGCACEKCAPWILTFAGLIAEIHDIARKYFPAIEPWMCAWWWTPEEYDALLNWAAREKPDWLKAIVFHIPYNNTSFYETPVPSGCRKVSFIQNNYSDKISFEAASDEGGFGDIYGRFGPSIGVKRIPQTLENTARQGATGFQIYSEGVFDDVNKVLAASLASGRATSVDDILREYSARYFGANATDAARWSQWLMLWGQRNRVPLAEAEREFEELVSRTEYDPSNWRLEQWRSKLKLEKLDRAIMASGEKWDTDRLQLVAQFHAEKEHLFRHVYKLGPVRHILSRRLFQPAWNESWLAHTASTQRAALLPEEA
jgi:hypothetical protein